MQCIWGIEPPASLFVRQCLWMILSSMPFQASTEGVALPITRGIFNSLALCMATPKDICPSDDTPEHYMSERVGELRELVEMYESEISAYCDIEEGWETKEED